MWLIAAALAAAASGIWLDVPYVKQAKNGCGAASLAMVMQYWRAKAAAVDALAADADRIQGALYSAPARGVFASDMEAYLRENGFDAWAFRGTVADLEHHLEKGRPLIVCLKQGGPLHFVVVAGMDPARGVVLVNDPARRKLLALDRSGFERDWKDRWTLLALPRPAR